MSVSRLARRAAWLAAFPLMLAAQASDLDAGRLPAGWQPFAPADGGSLAGHFAQADATDRALLVQNPRDAAYGLAILPDPASGRPAAIVKTFTDVATNPPHLSRIAAGTYPAACRAGAPCTPLNVSREAIGLCFGEAGCSIVYFDGNGYREAAVTD